MRVVLLFGGRSAEHDVSIVSSDYVREVLHRCGHDVIPVRIHKDGSWSGEETRVSIDTGNTPWRLMIGGEELDFDIVFPVLHGPFGEDGTLQGLCAMAGWPCTGADVMTSSMAMNKVTAKEIADYHHIPVMPWETLTAEDFRKDETPSDLDYPLFVKPAGMGSSVGITMVASPEELSSALNTAFRYDDLVLLEKAMHNAREIEVALLSEGEMISSSVAGEVVPGLEWYDYRAK
ncbi:MAG: D-alanine--D-alanine ligase A, partial [Candidatus Aegiribacteria sp.]|nr:D-alanine--D-alanine ligase A [Candidatus Aegiribacteria sp.]MBD3294575.1 D-alanine--D-alanine ligase A [Candidatus Fermentibacteria bacterium]